MGEGWKRARDAARATRVKAAEDNVSSSEAPDAKWTLTEHPSGQYRQLQRIGDSGFYYFPNSNARVIDAVCDRLNALERGKQAAEDALVAIAGHSCSGVTDLDPYRTHYDQCHVMQRIAEDALDRIKAHKGGK